MPSTALKPKHPGGRPTAYRPEFGEMIIEAMATGLSAAAAAAKIGISARSLFNWQKEHPEFLQSVQEGRHRAPGRLPYSQVTLESSTCKHR